MSCRWLQEFFSVIPLDVNLKVWLVWADAAFSFNDQESEGLSTKTYWTVILDSSAEDFIDQLFAYCWNPSI